VRQKLSEFVPCGEPAWYGSMARSAVRSRIGRSSREVFRARRFGISRRISSVSPLSSFNLRRVTVGSTWPLLVLTVPSLE
jgi:hypothetical protein